MKISHLAIIISFAFLYACKNDEFPACNCDNGNDGLLCMEYIFIKNKYDGKKHFSYSADGKLKELIFEDKKSNITKTTYVYNANGLIDKETWSVNNMADSIIIYNYNVNDSIRLKEHYKGENQTGQTKYFYNTNGMPAGKKTYKAESLTDITIYVYDSYNTLWKIQNFSSDSVLINYYLFKQFHNGILRIDYYDNSENKTGYEIIIKAPEGNITSRIMYNSAGDIISEEIYEYSDNLLKETRTYDGNKSLVSRRVFIYYNKN